MSGGPTTGALSTLPAHSHFAATALAIPISRAWSRPRMTPALRSRRSSSSPSHSRTDLGQPCTAAPRRGGTARVNGIARPSRNGRCQSSRRRGMSSRCRSGTAPGGTRPPGLPRAPGATKGPLRRPRSLVRYGERHIAQDACWLAVTFTHLRAALAQAMAANLWPGIGFGTRRCTNNRVPSNQQMETTP